MTTPRRPSHPWRIAAVLGLAAVLALAAQQALAAQVGGWLAGAWVTTIEFILGLLAPLFGG